jgi:hypothetical protein
MDSVLARCVSVCGVSVDEVIVAVTNLCRLSDGGSQDSPAPFKFTVYSQRPGSKARCISVCGVSVDEVIVAVTNFCGLSDGGSEDYLYLSSLQSTFRDRGTKQGVWLQWRWCESHRVRSTVASVRVSPYTIRK